MKKIILAIVLFICFGLIFLTSKEGVMAFEFTESHAGQVCIYINDFTNTSTDISNDDDFGSSYLASNQLKDKLEVVTKKNWLGIPIETTEIDV